MDVLEFICIPITIYPKIFFNSIIIENFMLFWNSEREEPRLLPITGQLKVKFDPYRFHCFNRRLRSVQLLPANNIAFIIKYFSKLVEVYLVFYDSPLIMSVDRKKLDRTQPPIEAM